MEQRTLLQPWPVAVLVISLCAAATVHMLPVDTAARMVAENGVFEVASAICLGAALVIAVVQLMRHWSPLRLAGAAMLLWALLRELDFQKRFTYRSVESLGYYSRPHAPWSQKLLVLLILSPFVLAGLVLVREICRRIHPAWKEAQPWTCYLLVAVLLGIIASVSEKLLRLHAVEEVLEAGIAVLILMLTWQTRVRSIDASARTTSGQLPADNSPL